MNTRQLRYLVTIIDEGSFSKAATTLHIAQPALSQHIFNLEQELDATLLVRSSRGVTPTPAGEVLYQHARKIASQMEQAAMDVRFEANTPKGEVTIVLPPMLGEHIAPPLLLKVNELYPDIKLRTMQALSLGATSMVESGRADIGIISSVDTLKKMNATLLYKEPLFLVEKNPDGAPPQDDFGTISFTKLTEKPLAVTREKHAIRNMLDNLAEEKGVSYNIIVETEAARLHRGYIRHGVAGAVLPWPSLHRMWMNGEVMAHQVVKPELTRYVYLAWPKDYPLNAATCVIRDLMLELLMQLFKEGVVRGEMMEGLKTEPAE